MPFAHIANIAYVAMCPAIEDDMAKVTRTSHYGRKRGCFGYLARYIVHVGFNRSFPFDSLRQDGRGPTGHFS